MAADRAALEEALRVEDQTERLLEVAAIVSEAVADLGVRPVVVGGLAVAFWTSGAYVTSDIDVLMPSLPEVGERLAELGFEQRGRYWIVPGRLRPAASSLSSGPRTRSFTAFMSWRRHPTATSSDLRPTFCALHVSIAFDSNGEQPRRGSAPRSARSSAWSIGSTGGRPSSRGRSRRPSAA
jgi:hypothetical protein